MIRFVLMLLAAAFGISAVRGFAQEARSETKPAAVENADQKTKKNRKAG
jgi:uncharacterized membrane protein